jgi:hypothetical protein
VWSGFVSRVTVGGGTPLVVPLEVVGGTLILEAEEPFDSELMTHVMHDGSFEKIRGLRSWAAIHGKSNTDSGRLVVPQMASGDYKVCRAGVAEGTEFMAGTLPTGRCVVGTLAPGGELVISVPPSQPRELARD